MRLTRILVRLTALTISLQFSACATNPMESGTCDAGATQRPPYTRMADARRVEPVAAESPRIARYRLALDRHRVSPCASLRLRKEVTFIAAAGPRTSLWEIQDFFAGNGTFIARHSEDVSAQLTRSGRYARTIVLPVPRSTPPGRYRVVSRLIAKQNGREVPLANAAAEFRVSPEATSGSRVPPGTSR